MTADEHREDRNYQLSELRLLLEELCCELCRLEHTSVDGLVPDVVKVEREFYLGSAGAFADIRVSRGSRRPT